MGYTHYWTQLRDLSKEEWTTICADIGEILKYAQHDGGVALGDGAGDPGTSPEITNTKIWFNGIGDDSHETMAIDRKRVLEDWQSKDQLGWAFCKTARKPYDPVVVACLCYLSTITRRDDPKTGEPIIGTEAFSVSSDGNGNEFVSGLDLARKALPAKANMIDLPMQIMQDDRWCAPWVSHQSKQFEIHFCIDGCGYVLNGKGESYCFETHKALGQFLEKTKRVNFRKGRNTQFGYYGPIEEDIWHAMGSFDPDRHERIRRAQGRILAQLFPVDPACAKHPPAYVRPGQMPANGGRDFCYSVADLMKLAD